ncbi:MAG: DUF2752 domain-containing protein [Bacteroidaceae bacterium]|nr:DUF2752 domain-containing protein [Bacteroidaceae bacterium]
MIPCPFHVLTGLNCPLCGTQRLVVALLHGHWGEAFHYNPLLFTAIPIVLVVGLLWFTHKGLRPRLRALYADKALLLYLIILFLWGIGRNFYGI